MQWFMLPKEEQEEEDNDKKPPKKKPKGKASLPKSTGTTWATYREMIDQLYAKLRDPKTPAAERKEAKAKVTLLWKSIRTGYKKDSKGVESMRWESIVCPRCGTVFTKEEGTCPECGRPFGDSEGVIVDAGLLERMRRG